jgi:tetratricopeptide (TPR) repeat protein
LGLQYLRECHNAKSIRSTLSGLVLALNHVFLTIPFEEDGAPALIAEVHAITHEGLERYPNGSLFHTFAAVANLEKNHTEHAIKHLNTAIDNSKNIVNVNPPVFMRLIVNCYAMDLDWKKASEVLEGIIEQEKQYKSKYSWSGTWNFLRLGSVYAMLGDAAKSKQCYEWSLKEKANDRWPQDLKQQATKFIKTGGNYSMFELMYLTGHFYKVIRNTTQDKRKELIAILDKIADVAPGSKTPLSDAPRPAQKSRFNLFAKSESHNNPEADNRGAYLLLKGAVLWTMNENKQCEDCTLEIINNSEVFANDKLYHVMALILNARSTSQSRPAEAIANLQAAMKITGYVWENNQKATCKRLLEKCGVNDTQVDVDNDQIDEDELLEEKDK